MMYDKKTALVTGCDGFVGRHLCPMLEQAGYRVTGTEDFNLWRKGWNGAFSVAPPFNVIVHLGANIVNVDRRFKLGMQAFDDIQLDYEVCSWIEHNPPVDCFIAMSSCAIDYPEDPYCIIKRTLEAFALTLVKQGVPVVILRPYGGYGPDQSLEYPFRAIFERAMKKEDPLIVWGEGQKRDFIHIDDFCKGILAAIDRFPRGKIYTLGTGIGTSFPELARKIADAVGYNPRIYCDKRKESSGLIRICQQKGQPEFGWMPEITLDEGIQKAVEYYHKLDKL